MPTRRKKGATGSKRRSARKRAAQRVVPGDQAWAKFVKSAVNMPDAQVSRGRRRLKTKSTSA